MSAAAVSTVKVGLVSLGCAKNLVDREIMAGHLHKAGMGSRPTPMRPTSMIVNTCSFIDAAKEESIGAILEANRDRGMRRRHRAQKLIVAGCMAQRFAGELRSSMPEVDAFIGLDQLTQIAPIIEGSAGEGTRRGAAGKFRHAAARASFPISTRPASG